VQMFRDDRPYLFSVLTAATLAGAAWLAIRMLMTSSIRYGFLGWNLTLAWIPFLISTMLYRQDRRTPVVAFLAAGLLWILFLPNAPYMITDLIHMPQNIHDFPASGSFRLMDWADLLLISYFILVGYWMGMESLYQMGDLLRRRGWGALALIRVPVICLLSGIATYIGRFERLNSWDVFRPGLILGGLAEALQLRNLIFASMMAFFFFITYGLYRVLRNGALQE